jgi:hypothetical protein
MARFPVIASIALAVSGAAWAGPEYDFERGAGSAAREGEPRTLALLRLELVRVAAPRSFDLCRRSAEALRLIQAGTIEGLVEGARRYMVDEEGSWRQYTREWLTGLTPQLAGFAVPAQPRITTFVADADIEPPPPAGATPGDDCALGLVGADPERGMPARAYVGLGPEHPRPEASESPGPARLTVEWFWLGQVMPAPNGPVYEAPGKDRPGPGAWYLADVTLPHTRGAGLEQ